MTDSKTIVIGRCNDDEHVIFPYRWAEEIKKEADLLGYNVVDLGGSGKSENFNEGNLEKMIKQFDPFFIFLNGHGEDWCVKGHGQIPVIKLCKNDHLFQERIVYSLSCYTAKLLGKSAIDKSCSCYIGYTSKFEIPFKEPLENPLDNEWAMPFALSSNEIPLTILHGGSPEEAYLNSQKEFDRWIKHWEARREAGASWVVKFLRRAKNMQLMRLK